MRETRCNIIIGSLVLSGCAVVPHPATPPKSIVAQQPAGSASVMASEEDAASKLHGAGEVVSTQPGENEVSRPIQLVAQAPICSSPDWSSRSLPPLLTRANGRESSAVGRVGAKGELFRASCTDASSDDLSASARTVVVDGVQISLVRATRDGKSGRIWTGNPCEFEISLADGSGRAVVLGPERIPPFNTVHAVVRSGSAVWLGIGFNGYSREFPRGGNRVIALDLCDGRVVWQSKDLVSNDGLLLIDDYLVSVYGFTSERRYVFVMDAHSGSVVQRLPIVENVCPSKSWAPNWHPGERCDVPGQVVGAATDPRLEDGRFIVDTNTGSSTFEFVR